MVHFRDGPFLGIPVPLQAELQDGLDRDEGIGNGVLILKDYSTPVFT